jgi:hypothetical protein
VFVALPDYILRGPGRATGLLAANDDEREPFSRIRVEITARDVLKNCSDQGSRLGNLPRNLRFEPEGMSSDIV